MKTYLLLEVLDNIASMTMPSGNILTEANVEHIKELVFSGRKIQAIKYVREITYEQDKENNIQKISPWTGLNGYGTDLKETKDFIEKEFYENIP